MKHSSLSFKYTSHRWVDLSGKPRGMMNIVVFLFTIKLDTNQIFHLYEIIDATWKRKQN